MDTAVARRAIGGGWRRGVDLGRHHPARAEKNTVKPWLKQQWCIPAVDSEFVWRMEDVLDLYAEPSDARFPVVLSW